MKEKILIIDDQILIRQTLQKYLSKEGFEVVTAEKGEKGIHLFKEEMPDLTLLDIDLPDINGIEVLETIKKMTRDAIVVMITGHEKRVSTVVQAMKIGAYDYVEKPFKPEKLKNIISKALETISLRKEVSLFRSQLFSKYGFDSIIGDSAGLKSVFELTKKIARSDSTTVLIQGESGTGKDLLAKVIHYQSLRACKPFMEINCTALPENLFESELFGYEKGAFTDAKTMKNGLFELSDGGTIFLDEIGDMHLGTQAKLLKIIENKTFKRVGGTKDISVDVRVIAATNKDLLEMVKEKRFREDLYFRLKVIPVFLPPLRERERDVIILSKFFISEFNREFKRHVKGITKETEKALLKYTWPGNIRELKNVIERMMILENADYISPEHLPPEVTSAEIDYKDKKQIGIKIPPEGLNIEEVEKELINQSLELTKWNQTKAAKLLNISRDALRYRMQKFNFFPEKEAETPH